MNEIDVGDDKIQHQIAEDHSSCSKTINSLPIEVLIHILQSLPPLDRFRTEQVCLKWKKASRETWRRIRTLYIIHPNEQICYDKLKNCRKPREFVINEGNSLYIGTVDLRIIQSIVSRVGQNITTLIIRSITHNPQQILAIVNQYCRNIEIMRLEEIDECEKSLYSKLFKSNKKLHSITCYNIHNAIEALPRRKWRCLRWSPDELDTFCEKKMLAIINRCESLEEFRMDACAEEIMEAVLKLPQLKILHFIPPDEKSLQPIFYIPMLNRLTYLTIEGEDLDPNEFSDLLQHCCNLERLAILWFSIPGILLETILALPKLETLELQCCLIGDETVIRLIKFKHLLLDDYSERTTDSGIRQILIGSRYPEAVAFRRTGVFPEKATDDSFFQMIMNSEHLETLALRRTSVTPKMFEKLVKDYKRHKCLKVSVSHRIYDEVSAICYNSKILVVTDLFYVEASF